MGEYKVVDVGAKEVTSRRASARGVINISQNTVLLIKERGLLKGDVLELSKVAAIMAAKNTSNLIPLCHPLPLDAVEVSAELNESHNQVVVECTVSAVAKTGVEMEAMAGVSAALLTVYDLIKGTDRSAVISEIFCLKKEGGKSGKWRHPRLDNNLSNTAKSDKKTPLTFNAAVVTISDRCSKGEMQDRSGLELAEWLEERGALVCKVIIPDELPLITRTVSEYTSSGENKVIVLTGGTGIGPRDITPEALAPLWDKKLPGFGEQFRYYGQANTPYAWISRAEAGRIGSSLVVSLPGSFGAVRDGIKLLDDSLEHLLAMLEGGKHP